MERHVVHTLDLRTELDYSLEQDAERAKFGTECIILGVDRQYGITGSDYLKKLSFQGKEFQIVGLRGYPTASVIADCNGCLYPLPIEFVADMLRDGACGKNWGPEIHSCLLKAERLTPCEMRNTSHLNQETWNKFIENFAFWGISFAPTKGDWGKEVVLYGKTYTLAGFDYVPRSATYEVVLQRNDKFYRIRREYLNYAFLHQQNAA